MKIFTMYLENTIIFGGFQEIESEFLMILAHLCLPKYVSYISQS